MPVLIQNVMYMFSWQTNGWILKECLVESQAGGLKDGEIRRKGLYGLNCERKGY